MYSKILSMEYILESGRHSWGCWNVPTMEASPACSWVESLSNFLSELYDLHAQSIHETSQQISSSMYTKSAKET